MFGFLKKRRRDSIRSRPFPSEWRDILLRHYSMYSRLPPADRRELEGHIHVFLAQMHAVRADGQGDVNAIIDDQDRSMFPA